MKYYSIGEFSKIIGKTVQTLRNWDKKGTLKPHHITEGGTRYYSQEQANYFLGLKKDLNQEKKIYGYYREIPSSNTTDSDINSIKSYMYSRGYQFELKVDYLSKKSKLGNLNSLLDKVINFEVSKIVILKKDSIPAFNYEIIENICLKFGTTIEIIDNTKSNGEDFIKDLVTESNKYAKDNLLKTKYLLKLLNEYSK